MKKIVLLILLSCFCSLSYAQTLQGTVLYNDYPVADVEVINSSTKALTTTDSKGNFTIMAQTNDELVFVAQKFELQKIVVNPKTISQGQLTVELVIKAEELKEVVVTSMNSVILGTDKTWEQRRVDDLTLENNFAKTQVIGVNMGTIDNGANLMRIGGAVASVFKREKEEEVHRVDTDFMKFTKANCDPNYYTNTLKLRPDQVALFLQYCETDPESKEVAQTDNILRIMDFLLEKSKTFKQL